MRLEAGSALSTGFLYSCGITIDSVAYCWGDNDAGRLGDGTAESRSVPTRVAFQP